MTLHHSPTEQSSLDRDAQHAIHSHGQPEYALEPGDRETRRLEHTGIELTGVELAYLKKMAYDKIETLENTVRELEESISDGRAPNTQNAEEELRRLREELDFLQNNLAEKLFEERKEVN